MQTVILRHQLHLERLKAGYSRDFAKAIREAEQQIVEVINSLETSSLSDLTRRQLNELLMELRTVQTNAYVSQLGSFLDQLKPLAAYESQLEARVIRNSRRRAISVRVRVPKANEAFKEAMNRPIQATGDLLEPFVRDWGTKEIKAVENVIRKGYVSGNTNQEMVRAIRGTKKNNYRDGVTARAQKHAETIVRTSVQHVASTARGVTWAQNADILESYEIVATLDDRTSQICRSMDGLKFEVGKGPLPPFHPNCRTTTVAVLSDELDWLREGEQRSSEFGQVDSKQTYYEWLQKQPASYQDSVLGPTRGKLFRNGGLTPEEFARLNLSRTFEPLTLNQMRKLEPEAFKRAGL